MIQHSKELIIVIILPLLINCVKKQENELTGTINVKGAILQYSIEGSGIPCVVYTGSENIGIRLYTDELKKHIKFIHGDPKNVTSETIKNITLDSLVDDIEKVRNALGVEKVAVMGHSAFGLLPLEYALKYPNIKRFIHCCAQKKPLSCGSTRWLRISAKFTSGTRTDG